jgi:hypothetical protein
LGRGRSLPRGPCSSRTGRTPPPPRWSLRRLRRVVPGEMHCRQARQPRLVPAVRGTLRSTNPPSSSRHARRARAVTAKGGTKVHAATIILHDRHRRRGRAPAREGVRERLDSGTTHSDTAGRATRQGRPASRFHVRCPPVGVHPLSFLNDLIRPSTPSNPRSFGPSCRVPRLPAPPL